MQDRNSGHGNIDFTNNTLIIIIIIIMIIIAFDDRRTHPNLVVTCGPVVVL